MGSEKHPYIIMRYNAPCEAFVHCMHILYIWNMLPQVLLDNCENEEIELSDIEPSIFEPTEEYTKEVSKNNTLPLKILFYNSKMGIGH